MRTNDGSTFALGKPPVHVQMTTSRAGPRRGQAVLPLIGSCADWHRAVRHPETAVALVCQLPYAAVSENACTVAGAAGGTPHVCAGTSCTLVAVCATRADAPMFQACARSTLLSLASRTLGLGRWRLSAPVLLHSMQAM